jgi:hypothetical protein
MLLWNCYMPIINTQINVSVDGLVKAVEQLSTTELQHFTLQVLALNAKRMAPSITQEEAELLLQINGRLPTDVQRRYDELITKRDAATLSKAEYAELLQLTKQAEAFDVARVEALSKLAARRGVTLSALMDQLEITSPSEAPTPPAPPPPAND